jgi:hypothetical protein
VGFLNKTTDAIGSNLYTAARDNGQGKPITDVEIKNVAGSKVEEQKTEADAVTGTLTFAENIQFIGIYNRDTVNDGVFNVNGINLTVPKGESVDFHVGGTPRATVTVTGSTSYIVTRYV